MGFWSTLGKIGTTLGGAAATAIPGVGPIVGPMIMASGSLFGGGGGGGGGAGAGANFKLNKEYTDPLQQFGGAMLPMAQQGFKASMDYFRPLAQGNQQALASATASDAGAYGRQIQQLTDRAARTMPRGGAMASLVGNLPQQQMAAGLERRIGAQQFAAGKLSDIAGQAGGLGTGAFSNLISGQLGAGQVGTGAGYLDLARQKSERDYYGGLGGSIFDILTGKNPIDPNSPLGKFGKFGNIFGGKASARTPPFLPQSIMAQPNIPTPGPFMGLTAGGH